MTDTDRPSRPEPERGAGAAADRSSDSDVLRKALAWFSAERNAQSESRYRRAAAPLTGSPGEQRRGAPGSNTFIVPRGTPVDAVKERLRELENLYNEGFITIEEYQQKRVEILDRL